MARRAVQPLVAEEADDRLVEFVQGFAGDPLEFVLRMFPWGAAGTTLHDKPGPDVWQTEVLATVRDRLAEGAEERDALRLAVASGHGIGKTALVAWLILWFMSTRPNPQLVVTANTLGQLSGKTWRELSKWHKLSLNAAWFQWTATKFYLKGAADTWSASAVPWSKERAEAFAGTHAEHVLLIFDEASAIDDAIWDVAEGAMTTHGAMWICFGNPTRNTGRFRECFRRFRHRWLQFKVDSREARMTNKKQIASWIEDYGEDSDFVRIRVKGEFPRAASSQFIPEDVVEDAMERYRRLLRKKREKMLGHNGGPALDDGDDGDDPSAPVVRVTLADADNEFAPLILMVDVARFGDDKTVVGFRRGNLFLVHAEWRQLDLMQTASRVAEIIDSYSPDATFIDEVGVGGGVVDRLGSLGYEVTGVNGALKALDENRYFNRRVEMWALMKAWLKDGGIIQDSQFLKDDLIGPEYGFDAKNRFQLESKDDMKARGLPSPDIADCLSMSFFMPVAMREAKTQSVLAKLEGLFGAEGATSHMAY